MSPAAGALRPTSSRAPEYTAIRPDNLVEQAISLVIPQAERRGIDFELVRRGPLPRAVIADGAQLQQVLFELLAETVRQEQRGSVRICVRLETAGAAAAPAALSAAPGLQYDAVRLLVVTVSGTGRERAYAGGLTARLREEHDIHLVRSSAAGISVGVLCGVQTGDADAGEASDVEDTTTLSATSETGAWLLTGHMDSRHIAERAAMAHERPLTVLVADDYEVNRLLQQAQLEQLGYRADAVANGEEVLRAFNARHYDVLLLDIRMPVLDGLETARRIRRGCGPQPFIIAVTAADTEQDRREIRAAGIDAYLAKPLGVVPLADVLQLAHERKTGTSAAEPAEEGTGAHVALDLDGLYSRLGPAADQLLQRVIPVYLRELPARRASLEAAFRDGDTHTFASVCHGLKGTSRSVGAAELAAGCERFEQHAYSGALPDADELNGLLELAARTAAALRRRLTVLEGRAS